MKCKHCDGTGTTNWCINGTFKECPYCDGTGEVDSFNAVDVLKVMEMVKKPHTNEDWFCGLSTEEKAMVIICCCPYESDWFGDNFEKRMEQKIKDISKATYGYEHGVNKIKNWLKAVHKDG